MLNALANYGNPFLAAAAIGLSCGTACSPLAGFFLSTYTMGRFNGMPHGVRAFGYFWAGKTVIVSVLVFLSAVLGRAVIGQNGRIAGFDLRLVLDGCLILTGVCLSTRVFLGKKWVTCGDCDASCRCATGEPIGVKGKWPLVTMGVAYGLTPCAPLLLLLLMVAMLPPVQAVGVGLVFCVANSVSPLLFLNILAGFVSQEIRREIPRLIRIFQITVFVSFIIVGVISLLLHLKTS
jgi:hypothetical protein